MIPDGLYALGARAGDDLTLAMVIWVTQTSFAPALVMVGVKDDSDAHAMMKTSRSFSLSMLKSQQKDMAYAFFKHVAPEGDTMRYFSETI